MASTSPVDPALLPPHRAMKLSPGARAQWPAVAWEENGRHGGGQLWKGTSIEGTWLLSPMPESTTYAIRFMEKLDDAQLEALEALAKQFPQGSPERRRLHQRTFMSDLGYARNADDAKALIALLRSQPAGLDVATALEQAGFTADDVDAQGHGTYVCKVQRHQFILRNKPGGVKLEFHRHNASSWENLCALDVHLATHDGKYAPNTWPSLVAHPREAAVAAALLQSSLRQADLALTVAARRRSPR